MKVNGKDYPIYEMENKTCSKPPTRKSRGWFTIWISLRIGCSKKCFFCYFCKFLPIVPWHGLSQYPTSLVMMERGQDSQSHCGFNPKSKPSLTFAVLKKPRVAKFLSFYFHSMKRTWKMNKMMISKSKHFDLTSSNSGKPTWSGLLHPQGQRDVQLI